MPIMMKLILILLTVLSLSNAGAQSTCFDISRATAIKDTILQLNNYDAFFIGESHNAPEIDRLKLGLIKYFHSQHNITDVFMEIGFSAAFLYNRYLETGDKSYIIQPKPVYAQLKEQAEFWQELYEYNKTQANKITIRGMDFERVDFLKTLKLLMPKGKAKPESIAGSLSFIDTLGSVEGNLKLWSMNQYGKLRKDMEAHRVDFSQYFGEQYKLVEKIMFNRNVHEDFKKRDENMRINLLEQLASGDIKKFVVLLGLGHTDMANEHSLYRRLQNDPAYAVKTAVMTMSFKNALSQEYKYLITSLSYKKNKEHLIPFFEKYGMNNCKYTLVTSSIVDDQMIKKKASYFILSQVEW